MNDTTCFTSLNIGAFDGNRLVFPCTLGNIPSFLQLLKGLEGVVVDAVQKGM